MRSTKNGPTWNMNDDARSVIYCYDDLAGHLKH